MKKVLFLAFVIVFSANMAFAQAGAINIFADPLGMSCDHFPLIGTLYFAYAVHVLTPGATASQWSAPLPPCALPGMLWLSDGAIFPVTIGNSQTGVAIGYGGCFASPVHVLTLQIFVQIPTPPCCVWPVLPDPAVPSGQIEVVDCAGVVISSPSQPSSVINPDPTCTCNPPIAVEESTWGGIKSLYVD